VTKLLLRPGIPPALNTEEDLLFRFLLVISLIFNKVEDRINFEGLLTILILRLIGLDDNFLISTTAYYCD